MALELKYLPPTPTPMPKTIPLAWIRDQNRRTCDFCARRRTTHTSTHGRTLCNDCRIRAFG